MSAKQDIWMPLFIGDYLRDTPRLTTEKHGAYLLLIMDYWINGAPPDDDEILASITKMQLPAWRKAKPALQQLFNVVDGFWQHKRINEELLKASENSARYADRAKKAADKRWNKDTTSNATSIPSSNPQEVHGDMLADATSPSPSSNKPTELTHSNETNTSDAPTQVGLVCVAIKRMFDSANRQIMDMNQQNPKLTACIEAGATVDEFIHAAQVAIDKNKGFDYLLGVVIKQRQDVAKLNLHQGTLPPSTSREAGRQIAANSIFTPENTQHLQGVQLKTINEVHHEQPAITA